MNEQSVEETKLPLRGFEGNMRKLWACCFWTILRIAAH